MKVIPNLRAILWIIGCFIMIGQITIAVSNFNHNLPGMCILHFIWAIATYALTDAIGALLMALEEVLYDE